MIETTTEQERKKVVEYYDDDSGEIRWRVRNKGNHHITGASEEGFKTLRAAMDNYEESLKRATEVVVSTKKGKRKNVSTEPGLIADNAGSAGEGQEANPNASEAGTGGSEGGSEATSSSDS